MVRVNNARAVCRKLFVCYAILLYLPVLKQYKLYLTYFQNPFLSISFPKLKWIDSNEVQQQSDGILDKWTYTLFQDSSETNFFFL